MDRREIWLADFRKLAEALKPFALTDGDFTYISDEAPEDLVRPYWSLVQMGYFHGWL